MFGQVLKFGRIRSRGWAQISRAAGGEKVRCFICFFLLPAALRAAHSAGISFTKGSDFEVFRLAEATSFTDWG